MEKERMEMKRSLGFFIMCLVWIAFCFIATTIIISTKKTEITNRTKMIIETQDTIEIVSPVIDFPSDFSNMPSYCNPKKYKIGKTNYGYAVLLPAGTYDGTYKTIQEAQQRINEFAKHSMERWLKSGGRDF